MSKCSELFDQTHHSALEELFMKTSLIALFACCAFATSAFADSHGVHPPQLSLVDSHGVHPPQLSLADSHGVHPPQLSLADSHGVHPPQFSLADSHGVHPPQVV
jgi:hypothetical protein